MLFDDIPRSARTIEIAILMLYDPLKRNQKEVRYMLNIRQMKTVMRVIRKFEPTIAKVRARNASLTFVPEGNLPIIPGSSFTPPPR